MSDWPELDGPVESVAPRLLGARLTFHGVTVRLTEVEAYAGASDPGSHAFRGPTPRSSIMFGPPGRLYCYLSYGMHVCANVVVGPEGAASAVLLRAGAVVSGLDVARSRRPGSVDDRLARGPALLTTALGIGLGENGAGLAGHLELGAGVASHRSGPRVGLRLAADRPWRFWLPDEPSVSAFRRHPKATP